MIGKWIQKIKKNKRQLGVGALALLLVGAMGVSLFDNQAINTYALETTVETDSSTRDSWQAYKTDSTQYIGRIWTDKSVDTENVTLKSIDGNQTQTIEKTKNSDFLVSLSALSSASTLITTTTTPLDIVLVMDVSGSMDDNIYETTVTYNEYNTNRYNVSDAYEDRQDLYYSENGTDFIKVNITGEGIYYRQYTISAEGIKTVSDLSGNDDIPAPYANNLYRRVETLVPGTGQKKITALKTAVDNFLTLTNQANDLITEQENKHEVALVKFADDSYNDNIGDNQGAGGNRDYNYTQVVSDFTNNMTSLQNAVNGLDAGGATSADYGMNLAQIVLKGGNVNPEDPRSDNVGGARENSKKVVIFFTDGEPNHSSDFNGTVANTAIQNAGTIKDSGALIYSIGVFSGADPSDTTSDFNAYMHGISSNYPNATSYKNLGDREQDSDYYKIATDSSGLSSIFKDIFDQITQGSGGPTQITEGAQDTDGYITFTDTLGNYMQIDDVNAIVYGGVKFTKTSASTNTDYYFEGSVNDNPVYNDTNLSNIKIHVTKGQESAGDTITVQIPASLIPLRYFDIDEKNNMTVNEAYPIRVFYSASLKNEVETALLNGTASDDLNNYISSHKSDDGKQAYFYSNLYNGGANGTTIADFEPATSNKFYYFTEPTLLYTDENCQTPATQFTSGATYYYKNDYYKLISGKAEEDVEYVTLSGLQSNQTIIQEGYLYVKGGTRKLSRADDFVGEKGKNETGTATNVISPSWGQGQQATNKVYVSLGNNGRVSLNLPGTLKVSKTVKTDEGITAPEDDTFEFTLKLEGNGSDAEYFTTIFDAEEKVVEGFNGADQENPYSIKSGDTFTLKDGQYIEIYGLPDGIKYSVVETENKNYTTTNGSAEGATNTAEGTVVANEKTSVAYTNKFEVEELTIDDTSKIFTAAKKLTGRDWADDDSFTFRLGEAASQNTIQNAQEANNRKYTTVTLDGQGKNYTDGKEIEFKFGQLKYTKPGHYTYYVSEVIPSDRLPGMSYSNATYKIELDVVQDVKNPNKLMISEDSIKITQLTDNEGKSTNIEVDEVLIENKFKADSVESAPVAFKKYDSNNTGYNLKDGMFSFTLTGLNGAPMPKGATNGSIITGNDGINVNFDLITFDSSMVGNVYTYTITENIPAEATADNNYTVNGMTYDPTVYYVDIDIQTEGNDNVAKVKPDYTYYTDPNDKVGSSVTNENVVFNNEYNVTEYIMNETTTPIQGVKKLTGRDMLDGEVYTFNLALSKVNGSTNTQNSGVTISNPIATVTGGLDGQENAFNFEDVTFTKPGTYEFTISESGDNAGGVTYDNTDKTVTIVITDLDQDGNHTGQLTLGNISYDNKGVSEVTDKAYFVNKYTSSGTLNGTKLNVKKILIGRKWMDTDSFTFTIAGYDDVTKNAIDNGTIVLGDNDLTLTANNISGTFGNITFNKSGDYQFVITENNPTENAVPHVIYSKAEYIVKVKAVDNNDGTITIADNDVIITQSILDDGTVNESGKDVGLADATFTNTYNATGTTSIEVTKNLNGRRNDEWIDGDTFTFTLAPTKDYGTDVVMPQSTTLTIDKDTADHKASFGDITFNKAGDYEFKVTEVNEGKTNVTYSTEEYTVSVHVEDENGNGSFTVTPTIRNKAGEKVESIVFENTYTPSSVVLTGENAIHGTKTLVGRNSNENEAFNFTLTEDESNDKSGYSIAENGNLASVGTLIDGQASDFNFGDITFTKRGTYTFYINENIPEGANDSNDYTLEGVKYDNHKETVTVTVTDDYMNNTLVPTVSYDSDGVTFINKYDASDFVGTPTYFTLTKVFEGKAWTTDDVFEFTLTAGENTAGIETPMPENSTVQVNAPTEKDGKTAKFNFGSISYDTVGEYHYTVSEAEGTNPGIDYSKNVAEITVTVTDNKQGGLVASAKVINGTFINTYSSELDYVGKGGIELVKNLTGYDLTKDNQFTFTLGAADEASKVKAGMENMTEDVFNTEDTMDANGLSTSTIQLLPKMQKFTQDDVGKVYKYTVSETSEQTPGYTNDTTEYTIEISTSDDGSGTLTVSTRITGTNGTDVTYEYNQSKQNAETGVAQVVFNNTYTSSTDIEGYDASVNLEGTKTLTNRPMVDGEFQFNVLSNGNVVSSGTNTADGMIKFTPINYTNDQLIQDHANGIASKEGNTYTYVYDVEEVTPGNGVSIIAGKFSITVKVTDNGDGKLVTEVIYPESGLAFENAYGQSTNAELNIHGTKKLAENGTNHPDITRKFQFTITGSDGAPMPEQTTVRNDAAGNIDFGKIVYTMQNVFGDDGQQAIVEQETPVTEEVVGLTEQVETHSTKRQKTFTYEISESGSVPGVTNDSSKIINVTVTDNGDGTISITSDTNGTFEFVNTYVPEKTDETSPTDSSVTIKKVLDGRNLKENEFTFVLSDATGNGVSATNDINGNVTFPKMTFDKEGIYTYTISEVDDNKGGVEYDSTEYKATAYVEDDATGKLKVKWEVTDAQGNKIDTIEFKNTYGVNPTSLTLGATKVLDGRKLADKEFLFVLSDEEGNVIEEAYNDATGKVEFSELVFDKAGTYNFTVREKNTGAQGITYDESVYNIQVEVIDNGNGTLNMATTTTKDGEVSSIVFRNKAEKDSVPEQPEKGDTSNTSTKTNAGLFTSLAVDAAALVGIATLLKKRNAKK